MIRADTRSDSSTRTTSTLNILPTYVHLTLLLIHKHPLTSIRIHTHTPSNMAATNQSITASLKMDITSPTMTFPPSGRTIM
jgi:hypothetical protein